MRTWLSYFQSERQDWKVAGISSNNDCRCWRMRGLDSDKVLMHSCSLVSMRLTNKESGRRIVDELSESSEWRSGWQERVSGPARRWSGIWMILRSKPVRSSNHQAWQQLRFWA